MKKLYIVAISYNEEEHIKFWIDNHKNFVDDIILVDTGSTDKTVEIAKENGIKIFNYGWEHHFAKAKNFALKVCNGRYHPDWILFLSPDFWVSHKDMVKIREAIEMDDFDAYRSKLMYHHSDWFGFEDTEIHGQEESGVGQIVLFKSDPSIFYTGKVHETVDSSLIIASKKIGYLEITRHHDDTHIDREARDIYFDALRAKCTLPELDTMRENLYGK